MAVDSVKTAFRLHIGVNEDFIRILIWQHHQQQQTQKNQQLENIKQFTWEVFRNRHRKRPVLKSLFNKVSGLQPAALSKKRLRHRFFPVKLLRTRFLSNTSGRLLLEEHEILLKTVPISIPSDISKAYYQKRFVICFLRSTYGRFVEVLIETYNKGFSYSWIFSASWALPNA